MTASDALPVAATLGAGAAYLVAVARVRRWAWWRTASFLAGLAVLLVALRSGIDARSSDLLSVHMLQHLLLTMPAAALLVAGAPITLALRALRGSWRAALARIVRGRVLSAATRPAAAWSLFAAVLLATHLPGFYDLALRDPAVHGLEHAVYLWAAILFWTPLLAPEPLARRLGGVGAAAYLLIAMVPMTLIGVWLLFADEVAYRHYATSGGGALADQHTAGAAMWLGGTVAIVVALVPIALGALVREERRARSREAHASRLGVAP